MPREALKQPSPRKTGFHLRLADGTLFALFEYPFPESREKFNIFVDGTRTQSARTDGKGKMGDLRNYTYIKHLGRSMYVSTWIDVDARVSLVGSR
jgi:hypothetical protein